MRAIARILVVGLVYVGVLFGLTSTANAVESSRTTATTAGGSAKLAAIQQRGEKAIDQRLTTLSNLKTKISDAKYLSDPDRSALAAIVSNDITGLGNLRAQIATDTSLDTLKTHLQSITHDYRVYVIVEPQVHLVRAADAEAQATSKMQGVVAQLTNASVMLKQAGKDTTSIDADLKTATAALTDASKDNTGQSAAALALKANEWPGNSPKVKEIRQAVANSATQNSSAATALAKAADEISKA